MKQVIIHPFPPVADALSEILILGSFPSVKSRENGFYYGHPSNRFWKVLESLYSTELKTVEEKKALLLEHRIALWDSIASCRIEGSADSRIEDPVPNDIAGLMKQTRIGKIFTNGTKSTEIYMRFIYPATGILPVRLPSTSPANASWSLERLIEAWRIIIPK